ncbi:MAG TPA: AraC family transcriptional regulator [Lachnospiraceae bacterium]|nr:AraC family transcriptional regulator [Lachnospiraceae bacterium]
MCQTEYDVCYEDLNPSVLFVCKQKRIKECIYHEHDFPQLTVILSGRGQYMIDDKLFDVQAGDIIMLNAGVRHKNIITNSKEPTVEFFVGFTDVHFRDMPKNTIVFKDGAIITHLNALLKQEISKICYEMIAENESCQLGKYFMLKTYMMQLLLLLVRDVADTNHHSQTSYHFESYNKSYAVKRIINYLNENYEQRISLDRIAHNMYLSPVYISKIFKEETGESPINYLIKIRLEKAKEILEINDSGSIKSIAKQVGYEDVYHFSKLFKKYYGISPLYYKRTVAEDKKNA